jgi:antitoxin FitA
MHALLSLTAFAIIEPMATLTIRKLDEALKTRLRITAARNGRSMEMEAREILREGLSSKAPAPRNLVEAIRRHITPLGGVDLTIPPRELNREPPDFSK